MTTYADNRMQQRRPRKQRRGGPGFGRPGRGNTAQRIDPLPPDPSHDHSSALGGRTLRPVNHFQSETSEQTSGETLNAFALFSAYHLGLTADDSYQKQSPEDVAKRFDLSPQGLQELLCEYRIDMETIRKSKFDLAAAQNDIRLTPAGVSRTEIARELYDWYLQTL